MPQTAVLQEMLNLSVQENFSAIKFRKIMPKFIKSPTLFQQIYGIWKTI